MWPRLASRGKVTKRANSQFLTLQCGRGSLAAERKSVS